MSLESSTSFLILPKANAATRHYSSSKPKASKPATAAVFEKDLPPFAPVQISSVLFGDFLMAALGVGVIFAIMSAYVIKKLEIEV